MFEGLGHVQAGHLNVSLHLGVPGVVGCHRTIYTGGVSCRGLHHLVHNTSLVCTKMDNCIVQHTGNNIEAIKESTGAAGRRLDFL